MFKLKFKQKMKPNFLLCLTLRRKALNEVDREAGIHTAELMGGDNVNYVEDYLNTMTDLKRAVYTDVVGMLFSTVELRHAQIMLTYNSIDNPTTYMGF